MLFSCNLIKLIYLHRKFTYNGNSVPDRGCQSILLYLSISIILLHSIDFSDFGKFSVNLHHFLQFFVTVMATMSHQIIWDFCLLSPNIFLYSKIGQTVAYG